MHGMFGIRPKQQIQPILSLNRNWKKDVKLEEEGLNCFKGQQIISPCKKRSYEKNYGISNSNNFAENEIKY